MTRYDSCAAVRALVEERARTRPQPDEIADVRCVVRAHLDGEGADAGCADCRSLFYTLLEVPASWRAHPVSGSELARARVEEAIARRHRVVEWSFVLEPSRARERLEAFLLEPLRHALLGLYAREYLVGTAMAATHMRCEGAGLVPARLHDGARALEGRVTVVPGARMRWHAELRLTPSPAVRWHGEIPAGADGFVLRLAPVPDGTPLVPWGLVDIRLEEHDG